MTTATATAFGSLLRDWRQRRRLTQLDLGLVADVSTRHLSFQETGRSKPEPRDGAAPLRGAGRAAARPQRADDGRRLRPRLLPARHRRRRDGRRPRVPAPHPRRARALPGRARHGTWNLLGGTGPSPCSPNSSTRRCWSRPSTCCGSACIRSGSRRTCSTWRSTPRTSSPGYGGMRSGAATTGLRALLGEMVGHCRALGLDPAALPRGRIVLPLRLRHPDQELALFSTVSVLGAPARHHARRGGDRVVLSCRRRHCVLPAVPVLLTCRHARRGRAGPRPTARPRDARTWSSSPTPAPTGREVVVGRRRRAPGMHPGRHRSVRPGGSPAAGSAPPGGSPCRRSAVGDRPGEPRGAAAPGPAPRLLRGVSLRGGQS